MKLINQIPYIRNGYIHKFSAFILERVIQYRKNVIIDNIKSSFPELNNEEVIKLKSSYIKILTGYIFESLHIYIKPEKYFAEKIYFNTENLKNCNKNGIILASHFGNWEWSSILLPKHTEHMVVGIYKPLNDTILETLIKKCRSRFGLKLVSIFDSIKFIASNKEKSFYIFISDQSPATSKNGEWINFLNQDTLYYEGAAVISKRYDMEVFYQEMKFVNGKYIVDYIKMDESNIMQAYSQKLENQIKAEPEWWLWSHRRWKHKRRV